MQEKFTQAKRYIGLDEIRGCLLISMMLYHLSWDLFDAFNLDITALTTGWLGLWQELTAGGFIMLSGFCLKFSKAPARRGLIVFLAGLLVTAATYMFNQRLPVFFGILTFIGSAMLLTTPLLKHFTDKPSFGFLYCLGIYCCVRKMYLGYIGIGSVKFAMPHDFYANWLTTYLGFPFDGFTSLDYFPLFPHLFVFWSGCFLYNILINSSFITSLEVSHVKPLAFLGKHSLAVYLAHQPILVTLIEFYKTLQ
ncbi:MAG: heparan-alpha-glucosaminide N-acetyltransferase domain-containing protein [Phascolarctobacterium sp.]|nr:heparan-alpha-glucosaminide N-acetyltransferase domain-containing protein [Phascolarctobacterium sp.]